jgi:hypothetical protein
MKETYDYEKNNEGMFINTNNDEYTRFVMNREKVHREKHLAEKVDRLEAELNKIKKILQKHLVG